MSEYTLREYPEDEYREDLKMLLRENGLHDAIKEYCDKIEEVAGYYSYGGHRKVQENLNTILDIVDIYEEGGSRWRRKN